MLAHDGFFLRSFGIEFHEVAEWETHSLVSSYDISLRWSDGKACMVHSG